MKIFDCRCNLTAYPPLIVNEKDGSILVWIPPGEFEMGDGQSEVCPKHREYLDGYYLGVYCITNRQYQRFIEATGHRPPDINNFIYSGPVWQGRSYPADFADHPVVCVSWEDAQAYCVWAGLALPTDAQWERGARGADNLLYPWGNDWDAEKYQNGFNRGDETTCPVWAYPQGVSGFGTMNQSGNVWEWCRDGYKKDYDCNSLIRNPEGPLTSSDRVYRGGSWYYRLYEEFRATKRRSGDLEGCSSGRGFRPCLPPGQ